MERTKCCELRWKRFPRACAHMWGLPHVMFREASSRREDKRRRGRSKRRGGGGEKGQGRGRPQLVWESSDAGGRGGRRGRGGAQWGEGRRVPRPPSVSPQLPPPEFGNQDSGGGEGVISNSKSGRQSFCSKGQSTGHVTREAPAACRVAFLTALASPLQMPSLGSPSVLTLLPSRCAAPGGCLCGPSPSSVAFGTRPRGSTGQGRWLAGRRCSTPTGRLP